MREERFVINDRNWSIIEPLIPGTERDRGVTAKDTRLFLEAVLWRVRVGSPWRDLPPGFGEWDSATPNSPPDHHSPVNGAPIKNGDVQCTTPLDNVLS